MKETSCLNREIYFNLLGELKMFNLTMVGIIIVALFSLIGFGIGTLKVPEIAKFEFSKKTGGEAVDDVIKRAILFKTKGKLNQENILEYQYSDFGQGSGDRTSYLWDFFGPQEWSDK